MKNLILAILALFLLGGCSDNDRQTHNQPGTAQASSAAPRVGFRTISPKQAAALIQSRKDLTILDIRTPQELRNGAIQGSVLTPFWTLMRGELDLDPQRPLLLLCAVGGRSYAAGQVLVRKGFQEVYNLQGGLDAWKQAGLPVTYGSGPAAAWR